MTRWLSIALVATACGNGDGTAGSAPDAGAVARDAGPLGVELGAGVVTFAELPREGAEVELVFGPQGGWHFDLAARLANADPEGLVLDYAVRDAMGDGGTLHFPARVVLNARRVTTDGERLVRVGDRAVLDVRDGNALVGRELTLTLDATDRGGARAHDERRVRVVDRVR